MASYASLISKYTVYDTINCKTCLLYNSVALTYKAIFSVTMFFYILLFEIIFIYFTFNLILTEICWSVYLRHNMIFQYIWNNIIFVYALYECCYC